MTLQSYPQTARLIYLISGHNAGSLTPQEQSELQHWTQQSKDNQKLFQELTDPTYLHEELAEMSAVDTEAALIRIRPRLKRKANYGHQWLAIAAGVLLAVIVLVRFIWTAPSVEQSTKTVKVISDIAPGSNKAILTLASGKQINLTDAGNQTFAQLPGTRIVNSAKGEVSYQDQGVAQNEMQHQLNTIATPKGGIYTLRLADGSRVTLNAASSLKFPASFSGKGNRVVELSGEAFFEVAKDKRHPFIVKTSQQEITVLGTRFNMNTYPDEPAARTTLIEGSVAVNHHLTLKPGEQAITVGHSSVIRQVDARPYIAWYNGVMEYNDSAIPEIMREVARWYDVEVVYPNGVPQNRYSGSIDRTSSLKEVLETFRISGMKFRMEQTTTGRRLVVNP